MRTKLPTAYARSCVRRLALLRDSVSILAARQAEERLY
jgi:hypothetical protein